MPKNYKYIIIVLCLIKLSNAAPQIFIKKVITDNFPRVCVNAQIVDQATSPATYYPHLDVSIFELWQKNRAIKGNVVSVSNQVTTIDIRDAGEGVNIMFSIDGGTINDARVVWQQIRTSLIQYVRTMNNYDKTGILYFGRITPRSNGPEWVDTLIDMTNQQAELEYVFNNADSLTSGGYAPMLNALYYSYQMLKYQNGPKAVISITDRQHMGLRNNYSVAQLIDTAKTYSIYNYIISTEGSINKPIPNANYPDSVKMITDSLGGTTFDLSSNLGSKIDSVLTFIRTQLDAEYSICYISPDTIIDGDTNDVAIKVSVPSFTPHIDSVFWVEDNSPPIIELTSSTKQLFSSNLPMSNSVDITAEIQDDGSISEVLLYYRATGTVQYRNKKMRQGLGNLFKLTIPSSSLSAPGLDFYIIAIDDKRLKGKSPRKHYPQMYPHHIAIGNTPSTITATVDNCGGGNSIEVSGTVIDPESPQKVVLHHKLFGESYFSNDTLSVVGNAFTGTFQFDPLASFFEYYLHSIDGDGGITRYPPTGELSDVGCISLTSSSSITVSSSSISSSLNVSSYSSSQVSSSQGVVSSSVSSGMSAFTPMSSSERNIFSSGQRVLLSSETVGPIDVSASQTSSPQSSTVPFSSTTLDGSHSGWSSSKYSSTTPATQSVSRVSIAPAKVIADGNPYFVEGFSNDYVTGTVLEIHSPHSNYSVTAWIFDSFGGFVTQIELPAHTVMDGEPDVTESSAQYLYWDLTDDAHNSVGTGVYIWRIQISFDAGSNERFMAKTGVIR